MATITATASSYSGMTNYTINSTYPIARAYTDTSSTTYCQLTCGKKNGNHSIYFNGFDFSSIPSKATIDSVTVKIKCMVSSTTYISSATVQAAKGTTLVGSSTNYRTTSATTYTLNVGSWTRSELDTLAIYMYAKRGNTNSTCYSRIYGMDVTVNYTEIQGSGVFIKQNGSYVEASNVYRKVNGSWQEISVGDIDKDSNYKVN